MWKTTMRHDDLRKKVICIGPDVEIHIVAIGTSKLSISIQAPEDLKIAANTTSGNDVELKAQI